MAVINNKMLIKWVFLRFNLSLFDINPALT